MPHEDVDDALKLFPGVHYTFNAASGKLFLAGHVLTSVDYQEMRYNLSLVPQLTSIENNVVIDETVCKSMNDVLGQHPQWRGISVAPKEPGKFVIHGYIQTLQEATQLGEYVTTNFPYLDKLQSNVVVEETLNLQILGLLQSNGFAAITFQLAGGELFLAGRYPEQNADDFKQTLDAINKLPGVQTVRNYAIAITASTSRIDVTQQYAVTGTSLFDRTGYSAIINGKIYTIGHTIDGMKITGIELNEVFLEKDGMKYKIDYIH
jgi:type III secretion system YscD/HrpQ family protein